MNCHSVDYDQHIHNFCEVSFSTTIAEHDMSSFEEGG